MDIFYAFFSNFCPHVFSSLLKHCCITRISRVDEFWSCLCDGALYPIYTSWLWSPLWREGHTCNVSQLGPSSTLYHTIWDSNWYLFSKLWSGVSRLKTNQLHLYKQLKWLQRNYQGPKSGPQHIPHWEALSKHRPGSTVLCDRHPGSLSTKKSDFDRELLVCCDDYHIKTCKSKHRKVRNILINVHMKDSN